MPPLTAHDKHMGWQQLTKLNMCHLVQNSCPKQSNSKPRMFPTTCPPPKKRTTYPRNLPAGIQTTKPETVTEQVTRSWWRTLIFRTSDLNSACRNHPRCKSWSYSARSEDVFGVCHVLMLISAIICTYSCLSLTFVCLVMATLLSHEFPTLS